MQAFPFEPHWVRPCRLSREKTPRKTMAIQYVIRSTEVSWEVLTMAQRSYVHHDGRGVTEPMTGIQPVSCHYLDIFFPLGLTD